MRTRISFSRVLRVATHAAVALCLVSSAAAAEEDCRSHWGADDQRGAANRLTPAKALEAAALIQQGRIFQLGRVYEQGMPLYGTRTYSMAVSQMRGPLGSNNLTWNEEVISTQLGQVGTQFDGLGHIGINGLFFNCHDARDFVRAEGLARLGVEHVGVFFTRGVLVDVAGYKGVARLEKGYEISVADLEGALKRQGVTIREGDAVILHTGWGSLWMKDNVTYQGSMPGIGLAAGQWLVDRKIVLVGGDTGGIEVDPNPDHPDAAAIVHQLMQTRNGIFFLENLDTAELAREKVYEFAFVFAPLRIKGGTGSPGNPFAIR